MLAELKIKLTGPERGDRALKLGSKAGYFPFLKRYRGNLVGQHSEGTDAGHLRTGQGGRKITQAFLPHLWGQGQLSAGGLVFKARGSWARRLPFLRRAGATAMGIS